MSFVTNSRGEKLLRDRLTEIVSQDDTIIVKSEHGIGFQVSRFLFNFFSNFILPRETDVVLTSLSSEYLASVIQTIISKDLQSGEDLFNDTATENDTLLEKNIKMMTSNKIQSDGESELIPPNNVKSDQSDKQEISNGEALETVENCSDDDKETEKTREKENVRRKVGRPHVGTKIGDPKIDWDYRDGEKYIKTITCQVCSKVFDHKQYSRDINLIRSYKQHYYQHELETTDCGCDNIQFKSSLDRKRHWKVVHKGQLYCKACSKTYSSEDGYKMHNENVHSERKCDECDFKTSRGPYYLKEHVRSAHTNKDVKSTSFNCSQDGCEKTFKTQSSLTQHINRGHLISTCHFCDKQVKKLDHHITLMHSVKKYQCDKCVKAFGFYAQLTEHEKVEHEGLRYFCRYSDCKTKEQEYRDSSNRSTHERKRHGAVFKSRQ